MSPDVVCRVLINKAMTVLYWSTVLSLLTDAHHNILATRIETMFEDTRHKFEALK